MNNYYNAFQGISFLEKQIRLKDILESNLVMTEADDETVRIQ